MLGIFQIGSTHHDAEVHLVHLKEGTDDQLLVIGVLIDASSHGDNEQVNTNMIEPYMLSVCIAQGFQWKQAEDTKGVLKSESNCWLIFFSLDLRLAQWSES